MNSWEPRFLSHDEMLSLLQEWRSAFPDLLELEVLGTSPQGREILLATVHDKRQSSAASAPALWLDANIHATELTTSVAALHAIWALISAGQGTQFARARERRTFYIVPRQNPDGAELAVSPHPELYRSRPDTRAGDSAQHVRDIDGDGRVLLMRIPDPHGWWCPLEQEPRLLRPRLPHEDPDTLQCFEVVPEGTVTPGDEGAPRGPLDLNRNYPYRWRTEERQPGAGPAPCSEPEVRALIDAILKRPNIGAYVSYHTHGGVHLIPFGDDGCLAEEDRDRYRHLAVIAEALTGYPTRATFEYWDMGPVYGTSDDWFYDHLGVVAWTTEFWNPLAAAGLDLTIPEYWEKWSTPHELALLEWSDRAAGGSCFVDWYPFDHPQLGAVELGGWNQLHVSNPPPQLLSDVLRGHAEFASAYALSLPELNVVPIGVERDSLDLWRVTVSVANVGFLPTTVTERAAERGICAPVTCSIEQNAGSISVLGDSVRNLGQLAGAPSPAGLLGDYGFPYRQMRRDARRATANFTVRAPEGSSVTILARHPRAGRASVTLTLE